MGCGCGKNQSSSPDGARAAANLKKLREKRVEPSINRPTFPQIPQLFGDRRVRPVEPKPEIFTDEQALEELKQIMLTSTDIDLDKTGLWVAYLKVSDAVKHLPPSSHITNRLT